MLRRLVDSINGLVATGGITEQWVGLILLPIVGNAAEHVSTAGQCIVAVSLLTFSDLRSLPLPSDTKINWICQVCGALVQITGPSDGRFELTVSVAVGSSIQIALFVIPVLVIVGDALPVFTEAESAS